MSDKPGHGDSETNLPSDHTTDAVTLTSQCLKAADKSAVKPPKAPNRSASAGSDFEVRQDSRNGSESVTDDVNIRDRNSAPSEPLDRPESNVHASGKTEKDICGDVSEANHETERRVVSSVDETFGKKCVNGEVTPPGDAGLNAEEDSNQRIEHQEQQQSVSGSQRPTTASIHSKDPTMFPGRDDPPRGLGRTPLGSPSSLAGPSPLGRNPMGASPLGGARVPPIGGQLTPLAPIASASRGGPTHLVSVTLF